MKLQFDSCICKMSLSHRVFVQQMDSFNAPNAKHCVSVNLNFTSHRVFVKWTHISLFLEKMENDKYNLFVRKANSIQPRYIARDFENVGLAIITSTHFGLEGRNEKLLLIFATEMDGQVKKNIIYFNVCSNF